MCNTMNMAAGKSAGRRLRICFSGVVAPAEPPMTMMSRLLMELAFDCIVCTKAAARLMFLTVRRTAGGIMSVSPTQPRRRAPLTGRRILVVEDEYFLADDIGKTLRAFGAEIAGPVGHVEDAMVILQSGGILDAA